MKRIILSLVAAALACGATAGDMTLRVDCTFSGSASVAEISVDEIRCIDGWAGRRSRLSEVPLRGNGQAMLTDAVTGDTLYRTSFSSLFQEWRDTGEAAVSRRSFENVLLFPMPDSRAVVTIELYDLRGTVVASLRHEVDPSDILIRPAGRDIPQYRYLRQSGTPEHCIDVAIVAEGYTLGETELFYKDARAAMDAILSHEPFKTWARRFNFVAVPLVSRESGVSVPKEGVWKDTALGAHFSTFYTDRYLTTLRLRDLHDALAGVPYEHVIILANTSTYGGGGIYNFYALTAAHGRDFAPVVVHEFGHSFAGLADEYCYVDEFAPTVYQDAEPWERNITTMYDFSGKWRDMIGYVPGVSLYEGASYQSKGIWRGCTDCRMRDNRTKGFCPVCQRAIEDIIRFYTD